jgi:hypothetical protein
MAKYSMEIQSRQIYAGPGETSVSELFEAKCICEWSDDGESEKDFDITLESDRERYSSSVAVDAALIAQTEITAAKQYKVRNDFSLYPRPGFYGSFFKHTIQKKVPADGNFKFFAMEYESVPLNMDAEFFADMVTITTPWSE